ncbi:energy transducer TonB [Glacieibacterium frigidum]|uniref:TonB C-terminal domain-containing protein n=1 Tax=Glacieibacterium frigidum TaxID=2593303 RepID=A0A552UGY2_9SPHN|nr:energy transducer TonB [Glacieibacterium frigidum]TRW17476.1 hypothetical protein FMM06_04765 [Glacieibacterium frigidum]
MRPLIRRALLGTLVASFGIMAQAAPGVGVPGGQLTAFPPAGDYILHTRLRLAAARGPLSAASARGFGELYEAIFETAEAERWYKVALTKTPGRTDALAARLGLARLSLFSAPKNTQALLTALDGEPEVAPAVAQLRGRLRLNAGDYAGAMAALRTAVTLALEIGDAEAKATIQSAQADLAVAAALSGDPARAATYYALAGNGMQTPTLEMPEDGSSPRCDPKAGILAEDRVIFEVIVNPAGVINRLSPMWASRPGAPVELFGLYLPEMWRWPAGDRAAVWEQGVRIAVACAWNGRRLWTDWRDVPLLDWMVTRRLEPTPAGGNGTIATVRRLTEELAARELTSGPQSPELLPVLLELQAKDGVSDAAKLAHAERSLAIAIAAGAPPKVVASYQADVYRRGTAADRDEVRRRSESYLTLLRDADPHGPIAIESAILIAQIDIERGNIQAGKERLRSVLARPTGLLASNDEGRRHAAARLAKLTDADGRTAEATSILRAAGLPADLCVRASSKPMVAEVNISESSFPPDARARTIEGMVTVETRILANGDATQARVVYEQPAGLFGQASIAAFAKARAAPPLLAGRPFACTAEPLRIRWQLAEFEGD